jgi:two-component system phosphate regulon sensor histidine kinase PhoR
MKSSKFKSPIFLFYALVFYVVAQFLWWWYLIFILNQKIYSIEQFQSNKFWMIFGEGLVFFLLLIIGIIAVRSAFKKQANLNRKEENFLLSVSHELKTPIASVQLFLQTLQKHTQLTDQEKNKIYSNALYEVNRLDSIVGNILLARQIEGGESTLQKETVQLDTLIKTKLDIFKTTIAKNHKLKINLTDLVVDIDKISFDSILTNLIENSVKYSEKGKEIFIEVIDNKTTFSLKITDQGSGIKAENREHIFKKFYREGNDLTRNTKGTGLGLFIVKHLVDIHQGIIKLSDNKPKGLIVEIEIPKK